MLRLNQIFLIFSVFALTVNAESASDQELNDLINTIFTSLPPNPVQNNRNTAPSPTYPPSLTTSIPVDSSTDSPIKTSSNERNVN